MTTSTKPKAATPPPVQPAPVIAFPDSLRINLAPDARINVTLAAAAEPARTLNPWLKRLFFLVAAFVVFWFMLYSRYVSPHTYSKPVTLSGTSLSAMVSHPAYAAFGDLTELDLTVVNLGADPFTGQVALNFKGNIPAIPFPSESTSLKLESLPPGASATQRLKFSLGRQTGWFSGESLRTEVQLTAGAQRSRALMDQPILVAAIPYPRTTHERLLNSSLTAAIALLLWEVIRKRFFGWEAKG